MTLRQQVRIHTACVCHCVDRWCSSVEIAASRSCKVHTLFGHTV